MCDSGVRAAETSSTSLHGQRSGTPTRPSGCGSTPTRCAVARRSASGSKHSSRATFGQRMGSESLLQTNRPTGRPSPEQQKALPEQGFSKSGRPDLNRGPHRPELWAKFVGAAGSTWKSMGSVSARLPSEPRIWRRVPGVSAGEWIPCQMTKPPTPVRLSSPHVRYLTADQPPARRPRCGSDCQSAQSVRHGSSRTRRTGPRTLTRQLIGSRHQP